MAQVTINDPSFTPPPSAPITHMAAPPPAAMPAPSNAGKNTATATDSKGRKITVRRLLPVHRLRLFAIAGELSKNESWMSLGMLAWAISSIDGEPMQPNSIREIEACLSALGDEGLQAAAEAFVSLMGPRDEDTKEIAQNL
jgi:hypothetical protein